MDKGLISEERLDESVRRVLMLKVKRGLFDEPYLKVGRVAAFVGVNPGEEQCVTLRLGGDDISAE